MEEIKHLVKEQGHDARNLRSFISFDYENKDKVSTKPPSGPRLKDTRRLSKHELQARHGVRVRSASTGRDKKTDLRARYWALLFGNLQRSVNELFNTVQLHESLTECQEVLLVLQKHVRDFQALAEWFRVNSIYENTPVLERPTSLTWDISTVTGNRSGKSSPSFSGRSSPNVNHAKNNLKNLQGEKSDDRVTNARKEECLGGGDATSSFQENISHNATSCEVDEKGQFDSLEVEEILRNSSIKLETKHVIVDVKLDETVNNNDIMLDLQLPLTEYEVFVEKTLEPRSTALENYNAEMIDSPSEDWQTYDVYRKVGVDTRDKGTCTADLFEIIKQKSLAPKISQESQTDEIEEKKIQNNIAKNSKAEATKTTKVTSSKTAYSTALSRPSTLKVLPPKPSSYQATKLTLTNLNSTSIIKKTVSKTLPPPKVTPPTKTVLARSRTTVDIKPTTSYSNKLKQPSSTSKINAYSKMKTSTSRMNPKSTTNVPKLKLMESKSPNKLTQDCNSSVETIVNKEKSDENINLTDSTPSLASSVETISNTNDKQKSMDGWLTVKSRNRFKNYSRTRKSEEGLLWNTRFHQVSATSSLPALPLLPEGKESSSSSSSNTVSPETNPTLKLKKSLLSSKTKISNDKLNVAQTSQRNLLRRSHTTVTKTTLSFHDTLEKERQLLKKLRQDDISNDLLLKTTIKTAEVVISPTHAINLNLQEENVVCNEKHESDDNKNLDDKNNKSNENGTCIEKLSEDEDDMISDKEHNERTQKLFEEEERLEKEIAKLYEETIEIDTETDGTETDGEEKQGENESDRLTPSVDDDEFALETRYEPMLAGMSWGERVDTLEALKALVARHPGRAMELHQKLSNPTQRLGLQETIKKYQAKQAKAQYRRQLLRQEKANKLQILLSRVDEVKKAKSQLIEEKRKRIKERMLRAEQNRKHHLKTIVKKAHDEEAKLKEIAFINELEAQNKRHDYVQLEREQRVRIRDIMQDRKKKQEEKAAKEAAVEERKRALEKERLERLDRLQDERRQRDERQLQQQQQRERERQELAREKARDREERLQALQAQQIQNTKELQKRIEQKQEESARRHEENMEQIRQRALEFSIHRCHNDDHQAPNNSLYPTQRFCNLCNVLIKSEVYLMSHLRGRKHQEILKQTITGIFTSKEIERFNLTQIVDAPAGRKDPKEEAAKERSKNHRKRFKKIKKSMTVKGTSYDCSYKKPEIDISIYRGFNKNIHKMEQIVSNSSQEWSPNMSSQLDRLVNELNRTLTKTDSNSKDLLAFQATNGFSILTKVFIQAKMIHSVFSPKSLLNLCNLWMTACSNTEQGKLNCSYVILSNRIAPVIEYLHFRLEKIEISENSTPSDTLASQLMNLLATVLNNSPETIELSQRLQDVVSFAVCLGVVDQLAECCHSVRGLILDVTGTSTFFLSALNLLSALANRCVQDSDPTQLIETLHATELMGVVSILYGCLLPPDSLPRNENQLPPVLSDSCIYLASSVFRLLQKVGELDLKKFQGVLGAEGISLQYRHIASHLLWCCSSPPTPKHVNDGASFSEQIEKLLHMVIIVTGYFAVNDHDNQMLLVSGQTPSVLQQLCLLPWKYFSEECFSEILYPTLLACCFGNEHTTDILRKELSYETLEEYRLLPAGRENRLIKQLNKI